MDLETKISGEIVFSRNPGRKMREWRKMFNTTQSKLSTQMKVSPSVISDYETGRRGNPGINMIKKYVSALIQIDRERGGDLIRKYSAMTFLKRGKGIIDISTFSKSMTIQKFCDLIEAKILVKQNLKNKVNGYIIVDTKRAVTAMSPWELTRMYSKNPERALIFTNLFNGVACVYGAKMSSIVGFRPRLIVLNTKDQVKLAKGLAEKIMVSLALSKSGIEHIIASLRSVE